MTSTDLDPVLAHESPELAAAIKAVVTGDVDALDAALVRTPELIRMRSAADHRSTLLHYVASNGIEDELQLSPVTIYQRLIACASAERPELVQRATGVLQRLLDAGAEVDVLSETYGGGPAQTTLNLLVSSGHPQLARVQADFVRLLCEAGANVNGIDGSGSPLATAIAFSCIEAAKALAEAGARVDNIVFAAALDRLDLVQAYFVDGRLAGDVGTCDLGWFAVATDPTTAAEQAMVFAALSGAATTMQFLLDHRVDIDANPPGSHWTATALHASAATGRTDIARILLERGADTSIREDRYEGTPLDWAENCGQEAVAGVLREYAGQA